MSRARTVCSAAGENCGAVNILGSEALIYTAAACVIRPASDAARGLEGHSMAVDIAGFFAEAHNREALDDLAREVEVAAFADVDDALNHG